MAQDNQIKLTDTYAFGDGENDLEMFQLVNTAILMGNANDHVKQIVAKIPNSVLTNNTDDDGIANALKKLNLI